MSKAKKSEVEKVDEVKTGSEIIVLWKATRPLSTAEHEQLSEKLRTESSLSGVRIVLAPYSVDTSVTESGNEKNDSTTSEKGREPSKEDNQTPPTPGPDSQTGKGDQ